MENCVFCQLAAGKLPGYKVWENEEFIAVLDIFPKMTGQTVIFSRKHLNSDIWSLNPEEINKFMEAGKATAEILKTRLRAERLALRIEGLEVDHAHIKLYPVFSHQQYNQEVNNPPRRATEAELAHVADKLKKGE